MRYRNGREAKVGDEVVQLGIYGDAGAQVIAVGVLYGVRPDSGYYASGVLAPIQNNVVEVCLCDCIHRDDLAELIKKAGLDARPEG